MCLQRNGQRWERRIRMEISVRAAEWATAVRTGSPPLPSLNRTTNRILFPASPSSRRRMEVRRPSTNPSDTVFTFHFEDDGSTAPPPPLPARNSSIQVKKKAFELSPALRGTSIFVLGTPCPIKSSTAELLADELSYSYFDSDEVLMDAFGGESAAKAAKESDEEGFRFAETEVFEQLSGMGQLVVSAGDAAAQNPTNLGLLRHGIIVWIDIPLEMQPKSQLSEEDPTELAATYQKIRDGYANADVKISLLTVAGIKGYDEWDSVTPADMALEVLNEIEKLTRVKKMMEEAGRPF